MIETCWVKGKTFKPVLLCRTWFNYHRWSVSIILYHFGRISSIPCEVKSSLKVCLLLLPTVSDSFPKILINIEERQKFIIINNRINSFKGHVMKLESGFHHLSLSFLRDNNLTFFVPVNVPLAFTPLNGILFSKLSHFVFHNCVIISYSRLNGFPRHISCNETWHFVVLIS